MSSSFKFNGPLAQIMLTNTKHLGKCRWAKQSRLQNTRVERFYSNVNVACTPEPYEVKRLPGTEAVLPAYAITLQHMIQLFTGVPLTSYPF
ncbi:hypothetical protein NC652_040869 [Populus alba x Populus x berolinensis]|nr:hypothetical protein NC652_040869 [Populus alba x Populus x berolinensis]